MDAPAAPDPAVARYRRCLAVQRQLGAERDPERLAESAMAEVSALVDADRASLFLFAPENMELQGVFTSGIVGRPLVVPLRMGIVGTAILRRELTNISNACAHPYFNAEIDSALGYKTDSLLVVPVVGQEGQVFGGLELLNKATGRFTAEDEAEITRSAARLARWFDEGSAYPAGIEAEIVALRNTVKCDRGTVFSLDMRTSRLVAEYADGNEGLPLSLNLKLGIAGLVAVTGRSLRIDDVWEDPRFDRSVDHRTGYRTRSMLCVPLAGGPGEPVGVIQLINRKDGPFDETDQELVEAIGATLGRAILSARLDTAHEGEFRRMVAAMAEAVDLRDDTLAGHGGRSVERAIQLATRLGLPQEDRDVLWVAASLHDFGMICVDNAILRKPGALDVGEREQMRRHAAFTERVLARFELSRRYRRVPLIAAAHHEDFDGSGYPNRLRGNEIPFLARILSVADAYEAMRAPRPYRAALDADAAWAAIEAERGKRFDPVVVDALREVLAAEVPEGGGHGGA